MASAPEQSESPRTADPLVRNSAVSFRLYSAIGVRLGMKAVPATGLGRGRVMEPVQPAGQRRRRGRRARRHGCSKTTARRAIANPSRPRAKSHRMRRRARDVRCPGSNRRSRGSGKSPPKPSACRTNPAAGSPRMALNGRAEPAGLDRIAAAACRIGLVLEIEQLGPEREGPEGADRCPRREPDPSNCRAGWCSGRAAADRAIGRHLELKILWRGG
jgi:hypothetical protein